MGVCGIKTSKTNTQININNNTRTQSQSNTHHKKSNNQIEEPKERHEFKDFEEDNSGKMIDEGIKQIPSYKCPIPFDQLKELRDKFWQYKIQISRRWKAIREICESDAATAVHLLDAAGFVCKDNLRIIMELDNFDIIYVVPNFCIADPCYERDYEAYKKEQSNHIPKDIDIILYCSMTNKETHLTVSDNVYGSRLKQLFSQEENFPLTNYCIRLFYSGQEIVDDHMLYYHSIDTTSKLQVMCIKL